MGQQTDSQLTTQATQIQDETAAGANTHTRVGTLLNNLNDSKINNDKITTNLSGAAGTIPDAPTVTAGIGVETTRATTAEAGLSTSIGNEISRAIGVENTLTSSITGLGTSKQNALGFTPVDSANVSTDVNLGTSNTLIPAQNAVKVYADSLVVGLLNDRGNYDASPNTFPTTRGSGGAGAILKGNIFFVSVAGTLGGTPVDVGYSFRALIDFPGQTSANWGILSSGLGFIPVNSANISTDSTLSTTDPNVLNNTISIKDYITAHAGGIASVTGTLVDNTDPNNPVVQPTYEAFTAPTSGTKVVTKIVNFVTPAGTGALCYLDNTAPSATTQTLYNASAFGDSFSLHTQGGQVLTTGISSGSSSVTVPSNYKITVQYIGFGVWNYSLIPYAGIGKGYKSVVLNFAQAGTNNPFVFEIGNNDFGSSISWTRTAQGVFIGALNGAFDSSKSAFFFTANISGRQPQCTPTNANQMEILSLDNNGVLQDGLYMYLEVRLYP